MSEEKRPYRVTLTREETVWILAASAEEAERIGRFDERDILYDVPADVAAYEEKSTKIEEVMHNDDRTVAEFLRGDPPFEEREKEMRELWSSKRPATGAAEHAAWLASMPDEVSADGEFVFSRFAALRVDGASLPRLGVLTKAGIISAIAGVRAAATKKVERGPSGSCVDPFSGKAMNYHWYGSAAIDDVKVGEWLPSNPRIVSSGGPFDGVHFAGDGWEAVIMPLRVDECGAKA